MHSFIVENSLIIGETARLSDAESRHAAKVMRVSKGDEVMLIDTSARRFLAVATCCDPKGVEALVVSELPSNESAISLVALIGCLKSDKLEFVAQKLTELGVSAIIPVNMARCVATDKKTDRLEKIVREAVKQSERGAIPRVGPVADWSRALERIRESELCLMPWERSDSPRVVEVHTQFPKARDISILIGPEGGIAPGEASQAIAAGALPVTLGKRILRSETAAIATAALVQGLWGDV